MATPLKTLREELTGKLIAGMKNYGFEFQKRFDPYGFRKNVPTGIWSARIGFINHKSDFDIIMSVSLRIDALERLIHEGDADRAASSFSLGAELGNISEGGQKRWTVSVPDDVDPVSRSILDCFARIGLPYLERYSVMENALAAVSGDDKAAWLHSPVHCARAKQAIALAFLLNRREDFRKLAENKASYLAIRNDPELQEFLVFRDKLASRWRG